DGSADRSRELIEAISKAARGRVHDLTGCSKGNIGAHARLNQLVGAARSEWIAILNSDDKFCPGRFEALASAANFSKAEFLFGNLLIINEQSDLVGTKDGPLQPQYPFPSEIDVLDLLKRRCYTSLLLSQNFIATTSNMIFTKALHQRV